MLENNFSMYSHLLYAVRKKKLDLVNSLPKKPAAAGYWWPMSKTINRQHFSIAMSWAHDFCVHTPVLHYDWNSEILAKIDKAF